jgi:hypothetical protein
MKFNQELLTPYVIGSLSCYTAAWLVLVFIIITLLREEFEGYF